MKAPPLIALVLKHPINPWLTSTFPLRPASEADIILLALALRRLIARHELN